MNPTRTQVIVALLAVALLVPVGVAIVTDGVDPPSFGLASSDEHAGGPSTSETVGYVEGYRADDDLPADGRENATLEADELEAVVYRSMARVEAIRDRTFAEEVSVEVVSREEYQAEHGDAFGGASDDERLVQELTYEALFLVDRNTSADTAVDGLYGDAVDGYYDPATDEIVVVSRDPETPETNEVVLGHELVHALQDQRFDLTRFDRETIDQDAAANGLIEGEAVRIDTEYERRCAEEWDCVRPGEQADPPSVDWGLYVLVYHPYDEGPDYVDALREDGGWAAVDAAYDDPPDSTAEVIRPGDERDPVDVPVEDRSSEGWRQFEVGGEVAAETVGEAGMVAMFAAGAMDPSEPAVIDREALVEDGGGFDYDHAYTDGWAGDSLVTYVGDNGSETDDPRAALEHAGYVWRSEWESDADADAFLAGYRRLLEGHGADPVDDRRNTYEIDDDYPGAYYLERDGETVTVVRAPSVDDLADVEAGAAPEGDDTITAEGPADGGDDDGDAIAIGGDAGAGSLALVGAVVLGTAAVIVLVRDRRARGATGHERRRRACRPIPRERDTAAPVRWRGDGPSDE